MRGMVFDGNAGIIASERVLYHPVAGQNGIVEQDPSDWADALFRIVGALRAGCEIDAAVLTSQRSSVIPVDAAGRPLRKAIMWQDTRTRALCGELEREKERIAEITGAGPNTVYAGPKMSWIRRNEPEIFGKTRKMLVIPEYLIHLMTGEYRTDTTYAGRSLLMNLKTASWDPRMLELLGLREELLCEICEPGSIVGRISPFFAEQTGLKEGIPLITGGGDQQCASLGQGIFRAGDLSVNVGTGAFLSEITDAFFGSVTEGITCNPSAVPGRYVLEGRVEKAGSLLDWFLKQVCGGRENAVPDQLLSGIPEGPGKTWCLTGMQQDTENDAGIIFGGITTNTDTGDLLKALLEGIGYEMYGCFRKLDAAFPVKNIYLSGGMSGSDRFSQMTADILGRDVVRFQASEATAVGAWMNAVVTLGRCGSYEEAWRLAGMQGGSTVFHARPELHLAYRNRERELQGISTIALNRE